MVEVFVFGPGFVLNIVLSTISLDRSWVYPEGGYGSGPLPGKSQVAIGFLRGSMICDRDISWSYSLGLLVFNP